MKGITMRTLLLVLFLLGAFQACKNRPTDTAAGKFAAEYSDDFWGESKRLIQAVHEREWTIAYTISLRCYLNKLPADKVFEDAISRAIQLWLEPVKKVAEKLNKSVEVELNYLQLTDQAPNTVDFNIKQLQKEQKLLVENNTKLHIIFICRHRRSNASRDVYKRSSIRIYSTPSDQHWAKRSGTIGNTTFSFGVLLHEIGHVFGLQDTYPPHDGGQPASLMSISLVGDTLGEDDIKGIQWLYRYTHAKETIPKENPCFYADYEPQEWKEFGRCSPKHSLITLLKQAEAHDHLGKTEVAVRILAKAAKAIETHLSFEVNKDVNKINAHDEDGNTALHLVVKYFLASEKINTLPPSWWRSNNYPPRYWATVGVDLLSLRQCPHTNSSGEQRMRELKLIYDRCVDQRNKNCVCIDPQIKNNEGKTARDLAVEANATDIVQTIDAALKRP